MSKIIFLNSGSAYSVNMSYPDLADLQLEQSVKNELSDFFKIGANRRRQFEHNGEVPIKRYPELIIVGAKKCGTTALKIFMNYHPGFRQSSKNILNIAINLNLCSIGYGP